MKSVGEVMAIGRSFHESLQKALRGLETGLSGSTRCRTGGRGHGRDSGGAVAPDARPVLVAAQALREKFSVADVAAITHYDPGSWSGSPRSSLPRKWSPATGCRRMRGDAGAQGHGLLRQRLADLAVRSVNLRSDAQALARGRGLIAETMRALAGATTEEEVRALRHRLASGPCSSASTPARPSSRRRRRICTRPMRRRASAFRRTRASPSDRRKIVILGGGPNRIGQGIEFDYCCCHACFALEEAGSRPSWSTATRRL
jgi:carbamoyl-phosphate synthase large subunit